ncbi:DUF721 domain-containing protein [Streptomyces sp. SID1121]|uniref:DUF721 domain-containing protein n=1 Tax=Streptomyces sp. SID1121 TaxID=3425888 RepID=UPI004056F2AA
MISVLVTERAWELPAAGATLRERCAAIAPELAAHIAAVSYDPESGELTVCPESSAWATKARLEQTRVIEAANKTTGHAAVRALRILPPGTVPPPGPANVTPATSKSPMKTREDASPGFHHALAAHQVAASVRRSDPGIAAAVERQTAAMRELSRQAFHEHPAVPMRLP